MENPTSKIPLLAAIGHVCLQWSLLEMTILGVLSQLQLVPHDEAAILFGELDILPRFNRAIALAEHHKTPALVKSKLRETRSALQGRTGLMARRNQAVHGAHADADSLDAVQLTMVRWSGDRRIQKVSLEDLIALTEEIHSEQRRTYSVFESIAKWQAGE